MHKTCAIYFTKMSEKKVRSNPRLEQRLRSELEDVRNANMKDICDIQVDDANIFKWNVLIVPHCVLYNKGAYRLEIIIPHEYPFRPPKILFHTKIYHPNVDEEGYMHLECLSKYWIPSMQMEQVFRGITAVVNEPEPYHPCHSEIFKLSSEFRNNHEEFMKKAIEMAEKYSEVRPKDTHGTIPKEVGKIASRLRKELKEIQEANMKYFKKIRVDDIWTWNGLLVPDCIPYNQGAFRFEIEIPPQYPQGPPKIYFRTKIYHPNVYDSGLVDMRETCTKWNSGRKMIEVFQALNRLLSEPDPDHFPPSEISGVYFKNREQFLRTAEEFAKQFAERLSPNEFNEPEGKCVPFLDTIERIIDPVNSINLEEGKCFEIKYPSENQSNSNVENSSQNLSDKQLSGDCYEPIGKCAVSGGSKMPFRKAGEALPIEVSERGQSTR